MKETFVSAIVSLIPFGLAVLSILFNFILKSTKSKRLISLYRVVSDLMEKVEKEALSNLQKHTFVVEKTKQILKYAKDKDINKIIDELITFSKMVNFKRKG